MKNYIQNGSNHKTTDSQNGATGVQLGNTLAASLKEIQNNASIGRITANFEKLSKHKQTRDQEKIYREIVTKKYLELLFENHISESKEHLSQMFHALIQNHRSIGVWKQSQSDLDKLFETTYKRHQKATQNEFEYFPSHNSNLNLNDDDDERIIKPVFRSHRFDWTGKFQNEIEIETIASNSAGNSLFCDHELNVLGGAASTGKTTLALQFAVARAGGKQWLNYDVQQGETLYVTFENRPTQLAKNVNEYANQFHVSKDDASNLSLLEYEKHNSTLSIIGSDGNITDDWLYFVDWCYANHRGDLIALDHLRDLLGDCLFQRETDKFTKVVHALEMLLENHGVLLIIHTNSNSTKKMPLDLSAFPKDERPVVNRAASVVLINKEWFDEEGRIYHIKNRHGRPTTEQEGMKYIL